MVNLHGALSTNFSELFPFDLMALWVVGWLCFTANVIRLNRLGRLKHGTYVHTYRLGQRKLPGYILCYNKISEQTYTTGYDSGIHILDIIMCFSFNIYIFTFNSYYINIKERERGRRCVCVCVSVSDLIGIAKY